MLFSPRSLIKEEPVRGAPRRGAGQRPATDGVVVHFSTAYVTDGVVVHFSTVVLLYIYKYSIF